MEIKEEFLNRKAYHKLGYFHGLGIDELRYGQGKYDNRTFFDGTSVKIKDIESITILIPQK